MAIQINKADKACFNACFFNDDREQIMIIATVTKSKELPVHTGKPHYYRTTKHPTTLGELIKKLHDNL